MKKSPFIIYLMAALLGIQPALATGFSGGSVVPAIENSYIGVYKDTLEIAEKGNVTITGANQGDKEAFSVYGAYGAQISACQSKVTMEGGTVAAIYGGYGKSGVADMNVVDMKEAGHVTGNVYGGFCGAGNADLNVVTVDGEVIGNVYGGYSEGSGRTDGNQVTLGGNAKIVCGGDSGITALGVKVNKTAEGEVIPDYEEIEAVVLNGPTSEPCSANNKVTITEGAIANEVYGGASKTSYSTLNEVTISGTVNDLVIGGLSFATTKSSGYSTGNTVTITDGAKVATGEHESGADVYVCGGAAVGYVTNNTVAISGKDTEVGCDVIGGYSETARKQIKQNTITVEGGTISASLYGGLGAGYASLNSVTISGGSVTNDVVGAASLQGYAEKNIVAIAGGSVGGEVVAGESSLGRANGNSVFISGGELVDVYGARGNSTQQNLVVVSGGKVTGTLAGAETTGTTKTAMNNGVHLVGQGATITLGEKSTNIVGHTMELGDVYGAMSDNPDATASSGNSVDVYGSGITANSLQGMQVLNFHMLAAIENTDIPMVTLTSEDSKFALALGPELELNFDAMDAMTWRPGDSVTLVSSALGISVDPMVLAQEYNIYQYGDPEQTVIGTAKLELHQEGHILKLVVPGSVPEPTTGTLSLLALAALAARRRK